MILNKNEEGVPKSVKVSLISGAVISFLGLILFSYKRYYWRFNSPIDNALLAQFGDFIGGVVGTIVALIGFILLYVTLREQRKQFQKQNEDQIFYRVLEKQQARIINHSIVAEGVQRETHQGYAIFQFLGSYIKQRIFARCTEVGRIVLRDQPENITDEQFISVLKQYYNIGRAYKELEEIKKAYVINKSVLSEKEREEYLIRDFGVPGGEFGSNREFLTGVGKSQFYNILFAKRIRIYNQAFEATFKKYSYFLDGYYKEMEYLVHLISSSLNRNLYVEYSISQITIHEIILLYYYLMAGKASLKFVDYTKSNGIFEVLLQNSEYLFDSPTEEIVKSELQLIYAHYQNLYLQQD